MHSESEEERVSDFEEDFAKELHSLPHVLKFIRKLHDCIRKQRKKIDKLQKRLSEQKQQNLLRTKPYISHCGIQTDPLDFNKSLPQAWSIGRDDESLGIVDQVKQVADAALLQTGFVYEQTSGMYYDYNTGYYYDTRQGLYYDGNTGIYYYYDKTSNTYHVHSRVYINETTPVNLPTCQKKEEQERGKTNKDDVKKRKFISDEETLENKEEKNKEPEEGECSESENDDRSDERIPEVSTNSESDGEEQDLAKGYPPCMRIIVKETDLAELKLGSLFLVTCTGGSLGRQGDHSVLIPDINISKYHARFVYDETEKQYRVIDSGSRNGTFINGIRLSVAKQESEPHKITHGSVIKVGGTKLLCHIHDGNETCGHCEPGLVQRGITLTENKTSKTKLHKEELRRLKHKFGIEKDNVVSSSHVASGYRDRAQARRQHMCIRDRSSSHVASGYRDRAQARRQHVGSSDPYAKTQQSSVHTSITKDNKGFKLLSKMGWSEGRSLGKDGDGRTEPLLITCNHNKVGLGLKRTDVPNIELDSNMKKKQTLWRKTQKRYKEIVD
ncbi:Angiogenic factor with G patch and FHA domains 1 [Temnothorax longispinosus]|uniref:Angiogenic factor with G patch and FHA domains 1 n=1 Tax=Temnothorax longispinosus TaxID=300112 RepID=A0A4S2KKN1_9HYME|nr:Angiogenic factor with G patch and FHA domains 1 [Temnothorax longispinosus]